MAELHSYHSFASAVQKLKIRYGMFVEIDQVVHTSIFSERGRHRFRILSMESSIQLYLTIALCPNHRRSQPAPIPIIPINFLLSFSLSFVPQSHSSTPPSPSSAFASQTRQSLNSRNSCSLRWVEEYLNWRREPCLRKVWLGGHELEGSIGGASL